MDDLSSAWRATKSLYRLLTVHVRIGVETTMSVWVERLSMDVRLTLDGIGCMWFRLGHGLSGSDHYVLNVCHWWASRWTEGTSAGEMDVRGRC